MGWAIAGRRGPRPPARRNGLAVRHPLFRAALFVLALLLLASPVQASEWVEGDGFRFRLPDGFERVSDDLAGDLKSLNMSFGGGAFSGPDIEMEMQAYARDWGTTDQGVLAVMRMTVGGDLGDALRQQFDPQTMANQMRQGMDRAALHGAAGAPEVLEVETTTLGASHEAVHMAIQAEDPRLGDQVVHMAFANHESSIFIFMMSGPASRADADRSLWQAFATTVKLSAVGGIGRFLRTYWPFLAGGAVLMLLFVLLRSGANAPRGRVSRSVAPAGSSQFAEGASFSRAMDGLPTYAEPEPGPGTDLPSHDRPLHEPDAPRPSVVSRPTLRRVAASPPPGADHASLVDPSTLVRGGRPTPQADLSNPPPSASPAEPLPAPAAEPESLRRVVPPKTAPATGPGGVSAARDEQPGDDGDRFQRNADYLGS